jgi:hypothetical protein
MSLLEPYLMARKKPSRKKSKSKSLSLTSFRNMLKNLEQLGMAKDLLINPPDQAKMSEVLLEFARPLLDPSGDDEHFDKAIALAAASWNAALLPAEKQEASIEGVIDKISSSGARDADTAREINANLKEIVLMLLERKRSQFPDNKRIIVDYQISSSKDQRNVLVASTLPSSDEKP